MRTNAYPIDGYEPGPARVPTGVNGPTGVLGQDILIGVTVMSAQPQEAAKHCPRCGTVKSRDEFGENRSRYDGLQSYCRPCANAYDRERWRNQHSGRYQGEERWDIDRLIARIEGQIAQDMANGGRYGN